MALSKALFWMIFGSLILLNYPFARYRLCKLLNSCNS
jgi:hypothetical protein